MASQSLVHLACRYADHGWPVLPCRADATKAPLTKHGYIDATTDRAQIEDWFVRWPMANLGLATGKTAGVFVIDIDHVDAHGHDGYAAWGALCDEYGWSESPDALCVLTPSGGMHIYFEYAEGITNARGNLPKGIDVRGQGGYVLLPPSVINGIAYRWLNTKAKAMLPPQWLLDMLAPSSDKPSVPKGPFITPRREGPSIIDVYNQNTKIIDILKHYGYTVDGDSFTRPNKKPSDGKSGTIDAVNNTAYTFSSNDPAYNATDLSPSKAGNTLRPFDLLVRISFSGDAKAAVKYLCSMA